MGMLKQAADTVMNTPITEGEDVYDLVDYMNLLREGIFEAYTGIIQALKKDNKGNRITPHVNSILQLVCHVANDQRSSEAVAASAVGICGDIAITVGTPVRGALLEPFVSQLITNTKANTESKDTKDTCDWARKVIDSL